MNQNSRQFLTWVSEDLSLLATLHGQELNESSLKKLIAADFPNSLVIQFNELERPITPVMSASLKEYLNGSLTLDDLAADFAMIYLNGAIEASPNESAWLDEDHLERQGPMFEVREWYEKYGLKALNWRVRSDDNISMQLLFISYLLSLDEPPLKDIAHFMDFHVLRWIDDFAEVVFRRANTSFYASLAPLTAQVLSALRDAIAELSETPRPSKSEIDQLTHKQPEKVDFDPVFYSSFDGGW